jgi:hypothetical protein
MSVAFASRRAAPPGVIGADATIVVALALVALFLTWVPEGLICIGRYPEDDPNIAEVWT